jgi:hypothetical protein
MILSISGIEHYSNVREYEKFRSQKNLKVYVDGVEVKNVTYLDTEKGCVWVNVTGENGLVLAGTYGPRTAIIKGKVTVTVDEPEAKPEFKPKIVINIEQTFTGNVTDDDIDAAARSTVRHLEKTLSKYQGIGL